MRRTVSTTTALNIHSYINRYSRMVREFLSEVNQPLFNQKWTSTRTILETFHHPPFFPKSLSAAPASIHVCTHHASLRHALPRRGNAGARQVTDVVSSREDRVPNILLTLLLLSLDRYLLCFCLSSLDRKSGSSLTIEPCHRAASCHRV